jgi:hypothetical protein
MTEATKWEKVGDSINYLKVSELPENALIGSLMRTINTQYGQTHIFQTENGTVGINGCGALDVKLSDIAGGDTVKIIYNGKKEGINKEGKKITFHDVDVFKAV